MLIRLPTTVLNVKKDNTSKLMLVKTPENVSTNAQKLGMVMTKPENVKNVLLHVTNVNPKTPSVLIVKKDTSYTELPVSKYAHTDSMPTKIPENVKNVMTSVKLVMPEMVPNPENVKSVNTLMIVTSVPPVTNITRDVSSKDLNVIRTDQSLNQVLQIVTLVLPQDTYTDLTVEPTVHVDSSNPKLVTREPVINVTLLVNVVTEVITTIVLYVSQVITYMKENVLTIAHQDTTNNAKVNCVLVKNVTLNVRTVLEVMMTTVLIVMKTICSIRTNVTNHVQTEPIKITNYVKTVTKDVPNVKIILTRNVLNVPRNSSFWDQLA